MTDLDLLEDADRRARTYTASTSDRRVYPDTAAIAALAAFDEPFPDIGRGSQSTLELLDDFGSPGTVVSNGPNYFGFVIGATLPAAAAAERMMTAWDQCASSFDNSPVADVIEKTAARWVLDALDLPRGSAVGFGTSASAGSLACLTAARRTLLARRGWNFDADGLAGAPGIRVVVPETIHITIRKALRLMGIGTRNLVLAPTDDQGRIDPTRLPALDASTILALQAGEVNTGSFDPFAAVIPTAKAAGAWVHVDGAFGLWARTASSRRRLTAGIEDADSWTTDGHKWLNTPYDGAIAICRDRDALAGAMNSDAAYAISSGDSQKNLGIEFSRRPRGIPIWAAMRSLGRDGIAAMVEEHCRLARRLAQGISDAGYTVLNDIDLNQVLFRLETDEATRATHAAAVATGRIWFGSTVWHGRPALRMSVSSWHTTEEHIDAAIGLLTKIAKERGEGA
ncbi:MAG: aspartate aminotransferase family protein [Bauldia sp.]|nr:aspartate aminotransferase family protein [Bauldia sp.]